jgi:UDP-glucose 4-epimerase
MIHLDTQEKNPMTDTARKKVVVTGGSGRVGRYVLAELAPHYDVVNVDLSPATVGPKGSQAPDVQHITADVMDLDAISQAVAGADAVVHLAAIDYDWKAPDEKYITVNTIGTWNVLQAARDHGVPKVVLCSSISACGLSEMRPDWTPLQLPVDETHALGPVQAYSISKQLMEDMGQAVARGSDTSVICLRPMAVVLEENLAEFTAFIDEPTRHWLFYYIEASDLARAFRAAVEVTGVSYDALFISADDTCHKEPTVQWFERAFGALPATVAAPYFDGRPRASIFDNGRARQVLDWQPTSDFQALRAANNLS